MALATARTARKRRIISEVIKRQYLHERLADAACELYASACTLSRLDYLLTVESSKASQKEISTGHYFLKLADRRIREKLAALWSNDDEATTATADLALDMEP